VRRFDQNKPEPLDRLHEEETPLFRVGATTLRRTVRSHFRLEGC
jgi:hypothetical protein